MLGASDAGELSGRVRGEMGDEGCEYGGEVRDGDGLAGGECGVEGADGGDDGAGQSGAQHMIHLALRGRLRAGGGDAQPVVGVQHGDVGEQTASAQGIADDGKESLGGGRGSRLVQTRPERRKCTQQGDGGGILCPAAGGIRAHGGIYWLF